MIFFCKKNSVRKMFPFFANNSLISSLSMKSKILCKVTISSSYFIFSGLHMLWSKLQLRWEWWRRWYGFWSRWRGWISRWIFWRWWHELESSSGCRKMSRRYFFQNIIVKPIIYFRPVIFAKIIYFCKLFFLQRSLPPDTNSLKIFMPKFLQHWFNVSKKGKKM